MTRAPSFTKKLVAGVFAVTGLGLALVQGSAWLAVKLSPERMPVFDKAQIAAVDLAGMCERTGLVIRVMTADGKAFFFLESELREKRDEARPLAVVTMENDQPVVRVDVDRDGDVDRKGAPGTEGIGERVCDLDKDVVNPPASPALHG